jgi:hypothetical protein
MKNTDPLMCAKLDSKTRLLNKVNMFLDSLSRFMRGWI